MAVDFIGSLSEYRDETLFVFSVGDMECYDLVGAHCLLSAAGDL